MSLLPKISGKSITTIVTLLAVGLLFAYYFAIHIPGRKDQLTKRNYSELNKSAKFIKERFEGNLKKDFLEFKKDSLDSQADTVSLYSLDIFCQALEKAKSQNKNNTEIFDKFETTIIVKDETLCVGDNLFKNISTDTLNKYYRGFNQTSIQEISIDGINYALYYTSETPIFDDDIKNEQKLVIDGAPEIHFYSLIEISKLERDARRISPLYLNYALILLFLLVASMPLFRLLSLNPIERLTRKNITLLNLSMILGTALVILLLFSIYINAKFIGKVNSDLEQLANSIDMSFIKDIKEGYEFIEHFDCDVSRPTKNTFHLSEESKPLDFERIRHFSSSAISLFWIDENGIMQTYIKANKSEIYGLDVSQRDYFKRIINNNAYHLNGKQPINFGLQSIISWRTGNHLVMITKASESKLDTVGPIIETPVMGASMHFSSVMDPAMLPGFGFCIFDHDGNVWFHSNKDNNLNENFFDEIDNPLFVENALKLRNPQRLKSTYRNNDSKIYIRPVSNMPLHIATFYDMSIHRARTVQLIVAIYLLYIISLIIISAFIGIFILITIRNSKLKRKNYVFQWLLPNKEMNPRYHILLFSNCIIILFLAALGTYLYNTSYLQKYSLDFVYSIIITQIFLLAFIYFILNYTIPEKSESSDDDDDLPQKKFKQKRLEYIQAKIIRSNHLNKSKMFVAICLGSIYVFNILYLKHVHSDEVFILFFQLLLGALLIGLTIIASHVNQRKKSRLFQIYKKYSPTINNPFRYFILSWVILSTLLPMYVFYNFSMTAENKFWTRYEQLYLSENYRNRSFQALNVLGSINQDKTPISSSFHKSKTQYIKKRYDIVIDSITNKTPNNKDTSKILAPSNTDISESKIGYLNYYNHLQGIAHNLRSDVGISTRNLINDTSIDSSWVFYDDTLYIKNSLPLHNIKISPDPKTLCTCHTISLKLILSIFFVVLIVALFFLISFVIKRIFAHNFENHLSPRDDIRSFLVDHEHNKRLFITRMKHASSLTPLKDYLKILISNKKKHIRIDFTNINKEENISDYKQSSIKAEVIIIDHFDHMSNNLKYWEKKKEILDYIHVNDSDNSKQLIVLSHHHPLRVIQYFEKMILTMSGSAMDPDHREEYERYRHSCSYWKRFFEGYAKLSEPIRNERFTERDDLDFEDPFVESFVYEELSYGTFLNTLAPLVYGHYKILSKRDSKIDLDELILKIQSLAEPYYYALWSSLSQEEKFLAYDLAKDGFINIKNTRGIHLLMEKGIVVYENNLRLFNQSFNNFILTVVNASMEDAMNRELKAKGNWTVTRNIFLIIVASIVTFVSLGSPGIFNEIKLVLFSITALMIPMMKITSFLTPRPAQASS